MTIDQDPNESDERGSPQTRGSLSPAVVPTYTYILIGCIAVVFVAQCLTGTALSSMVVGDARSARLAGFDKRAFIEQREYWRILTGAVIHGGILHVVLNSYAFYSFGRIFEMLANRAHLAIVFLLSAIGGGLLSLVFLPGATSVGASGGIVGLIGYLTVYAFRRRQFISPAFRKNLLTNIGLLVVYGLILSQVIDNYGHLGGLLTGSLYGLIQIPSDPTIDPREAGPGVHVFGIVALGVYLAAGFLCILLLFQVVRP